MQVARVAKFRQFLRTRGRAERISQGLTGRGLTGRLSGSSDMASETATCIGQDAQAKSILASLASDMSRIPTPQVGPTPKARRTRQVTPAFGAYGGRGDGKGV